MVTIESALSQDTARRLGSRLQKLLAQFTDLALQGKQVHWHVTGPTFESLHLQMDRLVDDARIWADTVAERSVTLGVPVDGNAATVAEASGLAPMRLGYLSGPDAVAEITGRVRQVAVSVRQAIAELGELDPVSQDLVITIAEALDKHLWMLQAQLG
jgi:starvation-inducible DNA-binding protein